jgi:hypothetical protein
MMRARRGAQAMPIAAFCLVVLILMWAVGAITARDWMAQMRLRTAQLRRDEEVPPPPPPPPAAMQRSAATLGVTTFGVTIGAGVQLERLRAEIRSSLAEHARGTRQPTVAPTPAPPGTTKPRHERES